MAKGSGGTGSGKSGSTRGRVADRDERGAIGRNTRDDEAGMAAATKRISERRDVQNKARYIAKNYVASPGRSKSLRSTKRSGKISKKRAELTGLERRINLS